MNINIIIQSNPWIQSSASSNRWLTLIDGLCKLGVKIRLLIYGPYQSRSEVIQWKVEGEHNGIRFKYLYPRIIEGYWQKRFYIYISNHSQERKIIKAVIKEIENSKDIIWTDSSHFGFKLAVQVKKQLPQRKLFLEMSEFLDTHHYNKGNFLQRWKKNNRHNFFDKTAFHVYDGLALMTKTLLNHYQNFPKPYPKLLHLPMTVDLERFNQPNDALNEFQTPYIAFVGVMNDAKDGVNILIKAFNSIKDKFPNHLVYLVGAWNYDTPTHLKSIKEFGLQERVFWMKEYPRDQIPNVICNADLLVLPRPDSKQAKGGFPTKLGEYLATGNPVCATRVGEIPHYLTDNESVFFAEPGSVDSFAKVIDRALSAPENARRIGANGRKIAEQEFNKDLQSKKLYDFLYSL